MGIAFYTSYESDLPSGYTVNPSDWNGMFDGIGTYLNSVLVPTINSVQAATQIAINQGRLYLSSGNPFADSASSSSIYYGPCPNLGNYISIENVSTGTLITQTFTQASAVLTGLTVGLPYDVYVYSASSATVGLTIVAWTNATTPPTRGTDIAGRPCLNGNAGSLWVGAFIAATATTTQDQQGSRWVTNNYNTVCKPMSAVNSSSTGISSTCGPLSITDGVGRISALYLPNNPALPIFSKAQIGANIAGVSTAYTGIGQDTTTAFSNQTAYLYTSAGAVASVFQAAQTTMLQPATSLTGFHYFCLLAQESNNAAANVLNSELHGQGYF